MTKLKFLIRIVLGVVVILGQVGTVFAAPPAQGTILLAGTVEAIVVETNSETDVQTVVVKLMAGGESLTVRVSVETAVSLGLVVLDESGNPVVNEAKVGAVVEIDPASVIPDDVPVEEKQHPVGEKLAKFFSKLFNVNYEQIMSSHSDGFGFGVITQALWITKKLGGDGALFMTILDAKQNGDYSLVALPDGTIPQTWGQFKKFVLKGEDDKNLGDIMSEDKEKPENPGNGKPENPGNGNGKPEDPGKGKPENPGNGNGKPEDPGKGKPENPPGQDKDKQNDANGKGN